MKNSTNNPFKELDLESKPSENLKDRINSSIDSLRSLAGVIKLFSLDYFLSSTNFINKKSDLNLNDESKGKK